MVYGHYITDTVGGEHFFVEGCAYCSMSSGGQHEPDCPAKDVKVSDRNIQVDEVCAKCDFWVGKFASPKECQESQKKDAEDRGFHKLICPEQFEEVSDAKQ